jgi:hypothetical protein
VRIDPVEEMLDLKHQVDTPLCVNEGLWREADAYRLIKSALATSRRHSSWPTIF